MRKRRSPIGEDITTRPRRRNVQHRTAKPLSDTARRRTRSYLATREPLPMLDKEDHLCWQEPLSVWNQSAPRVYICVVLCFPCENRRRQDAIRHIETALKRLARERPVFAGRLQANINNGSVSLRRSPLQDIPFKVLHATEASRLDYARFKDDGFPPSAFINPRFGVSGSLSSSLDSIPVSKVEAEFPDGGLLLSIFLHHGLVDGGSLRVFLECFAAQTRGTPVNLPSEQAFPISPSWGRRDSIHVPGVPSFQSLIERCPEYTVLTDYSGPTQPRLEREGVAMARIEKIGKIFVFKNDRLHELREMIRAKNGMAERPSAYTSLAALTFAHITKARVATEKYLPKVQPGRNAMLWNSVNWRTRAFQGATDNYFGNAALPAVTKAPMVKLAAACDDDDELARLVPLVKASIDAVDQEYVNHRFAMLSEVPDPRLVGVNYDPRKPEVLAFNTWRHFGADVEWSIPGVPVARADAIRRAHASWNLGTALILPAKADSMKQELFVSLSVESMRLLCADEGWTRWIHRIIG
ncbi:hypothetical protein GGS23DRAFT_518377 [Durotheca rogersii]|uniref:uncharacterized protein n=1 Tax=Durotheca rogersii TaxID=419775 RepID=UPI00221F4FCE|nr:uncharacterized protein GGS23DRAFT_518377 [Durotheca rogersii]KAI5863882.1 hypothetical protein GGS23DRAFT_518377 [Durotheca rogersii]